MTSFIKLASIAIQRVLYYKTSFIINILSPLIILTSQYLLWNALYNENISMGIGGVKKDEQFSYILVAFSLNTLLNWSSENTLAREIRQGTIVTRCIRPVSFLTQSIAEMLGYIIPQFLVNVSILLIGLISFRRFLLLPTFESVLLFAPSLVLAVLLRILLTEVFGLLCFFTTSYLGILWVRLAMFEFFSGAIIPVIMFPLWLKEITYITPFPYIIQIPISILLNQSISISVYLSFLYQAAWICFFILLHVILYRRIRNNLVIAGG
ncbi:MAG: hypothetical protein LBL17_03730 [Coxiellaceae bacterium]|nr:hypothetical protein [Coxiellaceae bacterium]